MPALHVPITVEVDLIEAMTAARVLELAARNKDISFTHDELMEVVNVARQLRAAVMNHQSPHKEN